MREAEFRALLKLENKTLGVHKQRWTTPETWVTAIYERRKNTLHLLKEGEVVRKEAVRKTIEAYYDRE